jgi:Flp pilus assembly protein TadD
MKVVLRKAKFALVLMAGCSSAIGLAQLPGQVLLPGGIMPASATGPMDAADRLSMNLRLVAQNPYDVTALSQAGESALAVGDVNAALSFLARADELSPSNGRVKANLGTALVMTERPVEALRMFGEAEALGVPADSFAKDRGLAFDLRGDQRMAQSEYGRALRSHPDDEATRRLALSVAIGGDRDLALRYLEPLLRKRDQGAWRTRAFVLALTGDVRGGERAAEQVVPASMMPGLSEFMRRFAALTPAQKASAVNFGSMPSSTVQLASIQPSAPFPPLAPSNASLAKPPAFIAPTLRPVSPPPAMAAPIPQLVQPQAVLLRVNPPQVTPATAPPPVPAQNQPTIPVMPARQETRLSNRVGARLGPVDASRMPVEALPQPKGSVTSVAQSSEKPVLLSGVSQLPPPSGSVPAVPPLSAPSFSTEAVKPILQVGMTQLPPPSGASVEPKTQPMLVPAPAASAPIPAVAPQVAATVAVPKPAIFEVASAPTPGFSDAARITKPSPVTVASAAVAAPAVAPAAPAPALAPVVVPIPAPVPTPAPAPVFLPTPVPTVLLASSDQEPSVANQIANASMTRPVIVPPTVEPNPEGVPTPIAMVAPAPAQLPTPKPEPASSGLGSIVAGLTKEEESAAAPVPSDEQFRKARLAARRKAEADAAEADVATSAKSKKDEAAKREEEAAKRAEEEKRQAESRHPARIWVQVATGSRKDGLPVTMRKVREQAPDVLKGVSSAVIPFKATNRLLVGPFKSQVEARAMVSKLSKQGVFASTFTSESGQEVTKLSGGK